MTTTTNWPDPKRPGVPLFPERDGWHVMEGRSAGQTALTHWNGIEWGGGEQVRALNTSPEWYRYVGPILTPTQIAEMLAAERERCAKTLERDAKNTANFARSCKQNAESTVDHRRMAEIAAIKLNAAHTIRNLGDAP